MTNLKSHNKFTLFILCLFPFVELQSQEKIIITVENNICIQCNCAFLKNDTLIYESKSDAEGFLSVPDSILKFYTGFELRLGDYAKYYIEKENIDFLKGINCTVKNILETKKTINLKEIVIYAKKHIVEDEGYKLVYNVDKDLTNISVTTTDVLRKTPMVSVDINGTPSIKGDSNVKILVNDKEVSGLPPAQLLEQIPSINVQKIEIITSPGAKYDAEGTSGIINIITNKKINFKSSGYANLGIGTKGSHLFTNYLYNFNQKWSISNSFNSLISYSKTYSEQTYNKNENNAFQRESDGKNKGIFYIYQSALSKTSDVENLNISLNWYTQQLILDETNKTIDSQENKSKTQNGYSFYKIAVDYTRKLSNAIKIDVSSGVFYLPLNNKITLNHIENSSTYSILNNINTFDMEVSFSKKISLNTGSKTTFNFFRDGNLRKGISYRQRNISAYIEGTYKISNRLSLNAGTRYENYKFDGWSDIEKNNKDFFFDGNVNYKINNKTTFSFLFAKRTQRPSYANLLPISNYTSSNVISVGNPELNSGRSYSYEIGFSKFIGEQFIKFSPFYKHFANKISNFISFIDNIFYTSYINIDSGNDFGISVWSSLNLFKKLNINYGFDLINKTLSFSKAQVKGVRFLNNLNLTYKFTDDLHINFFGAFNSPDIYWQGKENSYTYSNFSLQKKFYNGNLNIAISVDNPFSKGIRIEQKYIIENYAFNNQLTYYNRGIRLFVIYKFGKKQPETPMNMQNDILKENNN